MYYWVIASSESCAVMTTRETPTQYIKEAIYQVGIATDFP
jgi:hypothetical protein